MTLALLAVFLAHPLSWLWIAAALGLIGMSTVGPVLPLGTFSQAAANNLLAGPFVPIAASGAINPHQSAKYVITKAGVAAMTLAAPTVGADDGVYIAVYSSTANAHTITATGLFNDGSGHVNVLTYAAQIGAVSTFQAYQGKWYIDTELGVTSS